jgi:uncharacterized membrane protein YraQ (UPF0718 family)
MFSLIVWIFAASMLLLSFLKNKDKTAKSLKVSWKFFSSMALLVLLTIWAIGFLISLLPPELVSRIIGSDSGFKGVVLAALFGSVVLIQAFIAFPLAGSFLRQGVSVTAIAAFVTTLVMVGVLTAPLEAKFFGKRFTVWRNSLSFIFAIVIALLMGVILR